ncbi:hypothetical protein DMB65_18080 [Flavobacterium cheongpyeongense]|uniref:Uncharacterized protein n=1 Tax=Flavobacterium cheongpyeongense TaxID=2212651 RepID=A0A2V4BN32_9FLAO|nr:hypothetical protein [Flavobacterium cheongpyeongense]PXY39393.1 hypothetical protein DMB65_18080 [Flavobacterium cheongpyeongense]
MRLIYSSILFLFISICSAQDDVVQLKNVSDTILNTKRTLKIPDPLNEIKTMQQLFPGEFYKLPDDNIFMSWKCKSCKPEHYTDVNGVEEDPLFPYKEGVATRLDTTISYSDSKGNQFKMLVFNHSFYDADGLQTSRFNGGLLGLAKFSKTGNLWEMKSFQPAIAAFGAFSRIPALKLVEIGEDQYAFSLIHANGGAGGPYNAYLYLIVGFNGKYQTLMKLADYRLSNNAEGSTEWSSTYKVVNDVKKKFFRDFVITTTGFYKKAKGTEDDFEVEMPKEVSEMVKTKKQFNFTIEKRLSFNGKWYTSTGKPVVKFSNIK